MFIFLGFSVYKHDTPWMQKKANMLMTNIYADTIYALASGQGRAGVSVVRVSGAMASDVCLSLTKRDKMPNPRMATLAHLYHPETGVMIDQAVLLWFPAPNSFTGEDVLEIQGHGGLAIQNHLFDALDQFDHVRLAERGEFSRRAFEQGKMDLTEAEGLNDLIMAETEEQRLQAMRQMQGGLSAVYDGWRHQLVDILAYLEADIDFPDEDLPDGISATQRAPVESLFADIEQHLAEGHKGERIRSGYTIVLLGAPNVGKSSLLNALAREDVAIVSDIAGTTRDSIEVRLDMAGFPVSIIDTAGLREAGDVIEEEGIRRAREKADKADLRLVLIAPDHDAQMLSEALTLVRQGDMLCLNKSDLPQTDLPPLPQKPIIFSAKAGDGLQALLEAIEKKVVADLSMGDRPSLTRRRHRRALENTRDALDRFLNNKHGDLILEAEDIRIAARYLGEITGRVDVEEVLGKVFSDFCIGK